MTTATTTIDTVPAIRELTMEEMAWVAGGDVADATAAGAAGGFATFGGAAFSASTTASLAEGATLGVALLEGAGYGLAFGVVGAVAGAAIVGGIYLIMSN